MAKKSFWQRGEDYAQKVSSEIIDQIKAGVAPWQKPWKPGEQISAENFSSGKKYSGGNSLYLMSRGIRDGRGDNRWGTYNQIREAGGQVRKGEKGTQVLFFTDRTAKAAKDEKGKTLKDKEGKTIYKEEQRSHPICKQYTVFNVEQAEGLELKPREGQVRPEWDAHRDAEKVIAASGPTVEHVAGDRAYYRMAEDKIVLPEPSQFPTRNGYYQTALHECGHATGHPDRMNRETLKEGLANGFGSPEYAREGSISPATPSRTCRRSATCRDWSGCGCSATRSRTRSRWGGSRSCAGFGSTRERWRRGTASGHRRSERREGSGCAARRGLPPRPRAPSVSHRHEPVPRVSISCARAGGGLRVRVIAAHRDSRRRPPPPFGRSPTPTSAPTVAVFAASILTAPRAERPGTAPAFAAALAAVSGNV